MSYLRAFSSLGCPELSLNDVLELAARHHLDGVELRSLGGTMDLPAYFAQKFGSPEQLREQRPVITVVALDTSFKVIGSTPSAREALLPFVTWAEAIGAKWIRVFDGGKTADAAELADGAATMSWWRELRAQRGWQVDLMVETHDALFTAEKINWFAALTPGVAILWDSHHTWKQGGEDPVVTWAAIKSRVVHIHVKDSVSRPSAKHAYTYVLPGEGEFPMAPLQEVLTREYVGVVSLEWEKLWHPYLPSMEEALTAAAQRKWW